ncbi:hypothetical protein OHS70_22065 [Streptomyces sp. NBC_00390]|uniref:hypothetical protein n=1 Tax=Streptomyces sp. NBC_00390 TaxID=2975736 RepID=UPI002E243F22
MADELHSEIEVLVSFIRDKYERHTDDNPCYPLLFQGGPSKAHQNLGYVHGNAVAGLQRGDIIGAIRQRGWLHAHASRMGYRDDRAKESASFGHHASDSVPTADKDLKRPAPPQVRFPPVVNGIDYLRSVVDHLTVMPGPRPRDLKYAVLHLYAATEVLLKARLSLEHWALIWASPRDASVKRNHARDFESCGIDEAIDRLDRVLDMQVSSDATKAINRLRRSRNQLQHDGLTQPAPAVEASAAEVLDFLLTFIHQHLKRHVDSELEQEIETIKEKVGDIKSFVRKRAERLRRDLEPNLTVQCPDCDEFALASDGDCYATCHFCDVTADGASMARKYAEMILGLSAYTTMKDGADPPVLACVACPELAMVGGVETFAAHKRTIDENDDQEEVGGSREASQPSMQYLCFGCSGTWDSTELTSCSYCGNPHVPNEDGPDLCPDCESNFIRRF